MKLSSIIKIANKFEQLIAAKDRGKCVFPSTHSSVTDRKDHFPINNADEARSAIRRCQQYSSSPEWYNGSLKSLINAVYRRVASEYPSIEIDQKKKSPGKG